MNAASRVVHVAVGILADATGAILIARRPDHVHQGGLWEFPGGKVEVDETVERALVRELREELGITVQAAAPLMQVHHAYSDQTVLLDVWRVTVYHGEPQGRENQPLAWVLPAKLADFAFPAADAPIIQCVVKPHPLG
ncbi:8-oxo-dGTP diphosphatase MutT [Candidatus Contendibacter odensensis]|uniref:8-oxo-dGTP diphosphatase n=1 Tax=Candidatus Contendobacter odensis Run_B_J11 TaxID=1400861 RepID=A0A7U7G9B0_9GAMM|nr:8-oxo-dGTP diphosphatase MutT [Candidatus Contendobacter odensis]CDH44245.1 7,8-dihydro-8-oxoguanine-triphosphatase, prefers dGTP [Candidatus Contendobacter odensis Run_B_J11]